MSESVLLECAAVALRGKKSKIEAVLAPTSCYDNLRSHRSHAMRNEAVAELILI